MTEQEKAESLNWPAVVSFWLGVVATVLAIYGAVAAPSHLGKLGKPIDSELPDWVLFGLGQYTPMLLGSLAAILGTVGLRRINGHNQSGDAAGLFGLMLGGLAAVIGAVQLFATGWPTLKPALGL